MVNDDNTIVVAALFERLDEGVSLFEKEAMIPLVYYLSNISFINDPAVFGQPPSDFY